MLITDLPENGHRVLVSGDGLRQLVSAALRQLSPAHRTVLVATFYHGSSTAAVVRQLRIPRGTARSRLHYALHALREQLQDHAIAC